MSLEPRTRRPGLRSALCFTNRNWKKGQSHKRKSWGCTEISKTEKYQAKHIQAEGSQQALIAQVVSISTPWRNLILLLTVRSFKEFIAIGLVLSISKSAAFDHPTSHVLRQGDDDTPASLSGVCMLDLASSIMTHLGLIKPWTTCQLPLYKAAFCQNDSQRQKWRGGP